MKNNSKVTTASKSNMLDYIATKKWEYENGEKPKNIVREPFSMINMIPKATHSHTQNQKTKNRGSGTMDIAWDLPSDIEEDAYGRYLELLKSGDLTPGTSFKNFEENYSNYDAKLLKKKKAIKEMRLSSAIQKIDNAMSGLSGILHMGGGGSSNKPKPPKIKQLNLAQYFKVGMRIADLTPSERELVSELVKKSLSYNKDN